MSLLKAIKAQLGLSNTPANNFTLDASADNGTMKLARGNAGATTQDILTVGADGKVSFPQGSADVVNYVVTDSTDISLVDSASSYNALGASFSAVIPAAGLISIPAIAGRLRTDTTLAYNLNVGLRIDGVNYWFNARTDSAGTTTRVTAAYHSLTTPGSYTDYLGVAPTYVLTMDITGAGIPVGTKTVQLIVGKRVYTTEAGTLVGTAKQTKIILRVERL